MHTIQYDRINGSDDRLSSISYRVISRWDSIYQRGGEMKELPAAEDLYALVSIDLLNDGGNYPVYHLTEKNGVVHEIDPKHPGIFSIDVRVGAGDPKVRLKSLTSTEPVKLINSTAADLTRGVTWTPGKPFAKRDIPATDARMGGDSVV